MSAIEFTSNPGKTFTLSVRNPANGYTLLASGIACTEITSTRYRASLGSLTGLVWIEAIAGATKTVGFADLDRPAANGFSDVVDSATESAGSVVNVLPLNAAVQDRVEGTTINLFFGEVLSVAIAITNAAGVALEDLDERTLQVVIEGRTRTDRVVINDESIERVDNTVTFVPPETVTSKIGSKKWSLRDVTSGEGEGVVLAHGCLNVNYAPAAD